MAQMISEHEERVNRQRIESLRTQIKQRDARIAELENGLNMALAAISRPMSFDTDDVISDLCALLNTTS